MIETKKLREILMRDGNVEEGVFQDIVRTFDKQNTGEINYIDIIDLFSRISLGARFDPMA